MPSAEVGGEVRRKRALNCWPWVRSLTHSPEAVIHSPAAMVAALEQLLGQRHEFVRRKAAMALVHGLGQRIGNPGANPDHRRLFDTELHGDGVGGLEADTADIARQAVRVLGHDLDSVGTVGLENPYRPRGAYAVAVQKNHDLPHRLLLDPGCENAGSAN